MSNLNLNVTDINGGHHLAFTSGEHSAGINTANVPSVADIETHAKAIAHAFVDKIGGDFTDLFSQAKGLITEAFALIEDKALAEVPTPTGTVTVDATPKPKAKAKPKAKPAPKPVVKAPEPPPAPETPATPEVAPEVKS